MTLCDSGDTEPEEMVDLYAPSSCSNIRFDVIVSVGVSFCLRKTGNEGCAPAVTQRFRALLSFVQKGKTMKKMRLLLIMLLMGVWMGVARADFLKPVTARASSEYSSGYVIANLFDGTPALGSSANLGGQWACSGAAELTPIVGMDFGGTTNFQFTGIGYSQRSAVDAVVTIKLWFSTCPMGWSLGSPPSPPPDETLSLTNTSNTVFSQYNFTTSH